MKRESTWGLTGILAVAATLGIVIQPWNQGTVSPVEPAKEAASHTPEEPAFLRGINDACSGLAGVFANFLAEEKSRVGGPGFCYTPDSSRSEKSDTTSPIAAKLRGMKFIVATVPDPVHSHLALIFDRFTEAIQQAATDERYLFESSWLPWDEEKAVYEHLSDQDTADQKKSEREKQPGVVLFRGSPLDKTDKGSGESRALAVFVVGEEATGGIHREQFRNASAWVEYLSGTTPSGTRPVAILGPSFSGSFSSLDQLLSDPIIWNRLHPSVHSNNPKLAIYSGSANAGKFIHAFVKNAMRSNYVEFHSFLQDDDVLMESFTTYIQKNSTGANLFRFAVLSEEATAYGGLTAQRTKQHKTRATAAVNQSEPSKHMHRYFKSEVSEGLYIALRLLLAFVARPGVVRQGKTSSAEDCGYGLPESQRWKSRGSSGVQS